MAWRVIQGDTREEIWKLEPASVDMCVTSPPYFNLRDYCTGTWEGGDPACNHRVRREPHIDSSTLEGGKDSVGHQLEGFRERCAYCGAVRIDRQIGLESTLEEYIEQLLLVFDGVARALKPTGTCWVVIADTYYGTGQGHKPSDKSIYAGRDKLPVRPNRNGTRRRMGWKRRKQLLMIPARFAIAMQERGWILRSEIIWHKPNAITESAPDRPVRDHEHVFLFSRRERYYYDREAVRQPGREWKGAAGTFKRKSGKATLLHVPGQNHPSHRPDRDDRVPSGSNLRTVWSIPTQPFPGEHSATFPPALVEPCILAGTSAAGCCPKCGRPWVRIVEKGEPDREWQARCGADSSGGYRGKARKDYAGARAQDASAVKARILAGMRKTWTVGWRPTCKCDAGDPVPAVVLDPFAGVLTTLYVAEQLGRDSVGIELNPAYIESGKREYMARIAAAGVQRPLWA